MRLLLLSSSVVHGYGFLDRFDEEIQRHLEGRHSLVFVPFLGDQTARVFRRGREPEEVQPGEMVF